MAEKVNSFAKSNLCTHILYCYENKDNYIKNAVEYLVDGIESGDSVILIESEKNLTTLNSQLKKKLTASQLEKVQTISNFDFYLSSGSYHPPAIYEQLTKSVTPYFEKNIPFRTWTNVEWGSLEDPAHIVDWFEKETDKVVHENDLTLVCAYDAERMPPDMQAILERTHPHIMTDEDLSKSVPYTPIKTPVED